MARMPYCGDLRSQIRHDLPYCEGLRSQIRQQELFIALIEPHFHTSCGQPKAAHDPKVCVSGTAVLGRSGLGPGKPLLSPRFSVNQSDSVPLF